MIVFLEGLAERAEKAAACGQMKIVYDTTRIISGKHRKSITRPVKDKHGNVKLLQYADDMTLLLKMKQI